MRDAIKNFPKQFEYEPEVVNSKRLKKFSRFVVVGMGGSHLAADVLKIWRPEADIIVHSDYGLPSCDDRSAVRGLPAGIDKKKTLVIASSYSGNTEETLDSFAMAGEQGIARAAIATGGELLNRAKAAGVPHIQVPATGIQPRSALGFMFKALLKLFKDEASLAETTRLSKTLAMGAAELFGKGFAPKLKGFIPVVYASLRNQAIAANWKIKFNETGKVPAFYNVFSELNHNEMTGVDGQGAAAELGKRLYYIFLSDPADDRRIQKRMEVMAKLYQDRGLRVERVVLAGASSLETIFNSLLAADWTAFYLAELYGSDPEQVPLVEEFKKLIAR